MPLGVAGLSLVWNTSFIWASVTSVQSHIDLTPEGCCEIPLT